MSFRSQADVTPSSVETETLNSYALVAQLATGELTTIHSARRAEDGDGSQQGDARYVIKRLHRHHVREQEYRGVLIGSARAVLGVACPHLVSVLDVHEQPEPFVVMERVQGIRLSQLLDGAPAAIAPRLALPILVDALRGLQVLHTLGGADRPAALVHGAPHARHILVSPDGRGRLIDLTHGIGLGLPRSPHHDQRLRPMEMAPEQALAPTCVDARCDLFIVGTVLWRALAGQRLFEAENREAAMQRMLHESIATPSTVGSFWSKGLDRVCMRALERARMRRYPSAAEMAEALQEQAQQAGCFASFEEIGAFVRELSRGAASQGHDVAEPLTGSTLAGFGNPAPPSGESEQSRLPRPARIGEAQREVRAARDARDKSVAARAQSVSVRERSVSTRERNTVARGRALEASDGRKSKVAPASNSAWGQGVAAVGGAPASSIIEAGGQQPDAGAVGDDLRATSQGPVALRGARESDRPSAIPRGWGEPRMSLPPARTNLAATLLKAAVFVVALSMPAALLLTISGPRGRSLKPVGAEPSGDVVGSVPGVAADRSANGGAEPPRQATAKSAFSLRREHPRGAPGLHSSAAAPALSATAFGSVAPKATSTSAKRNSVAAAKNKDASKKIGARQRKREGILATGVEAGDSQPIATTPERPLGEALPINPY